MNSSPSLKELATALSKFQGECPPIPKNREVEVTMRNGGKYRYRYAEYDQIVEIVGPLLAKHGLSYTFPESNREFTSCLLLHSSGEWTLTKILNIGNPQDMKEAKSMTTYGKRGALELALGIPVTEDEDGSVGTGEDFTKKELPPKSKPTQSGNPLEDYIIPFGKPEVKGMRLADADLFQVESLRKWVNGQEKKSKSMQDFLEKSEAFLKLREFKR
jgi:hypothetical protein